MAGSVVKTRSRIFFLWLVCEHVGAGSSFELDQQKYVDPGGAGL